MLQQTPRRVVLRDVPLIAGARLDSLVRAYARKLSGRTAYGAGLVAAAVLALAYLRGADLRGSLVGAPPSVLPVVTSVTDDDRA
jgi:hypothetical protein